MKKVNLTVLLMLWMFSSGAQNVAWTTELENSRPNIFGIDEFNGVRSMAYSPSNSDLYVLGTKYFQLPAIPSGYGHGKEIAVYCYDPTSGNVISSVILSHHSNDTLEFYDDASALLVGNDGSIYVTGKYFYNTQQGYDMIVVKFDAALNELWRHYFRGVPGSEECGYALALDNNGNLIVLGRMDDRGAAKGADFLISKFNPSSGTPVWTKFRNTLGVQSDQPADVVCDNEGNIYFCGTSSLAAARNRFVTVKLDSMGIFQWIRKYNPVAYYAVDEGARSIAIDTINARVYVTGTSYFSTTGTDITTISYDLNGDRQWVKSIDGSSASIDQGCKVVVGPGGNIFTGGKIDFLSGSTYKSRLIFREYDVNGNTLMTRRYGSTAFNSYFGDMVVSSTGDVFITGTSRVAGGDVSLLTIKYNSSGALKWDDFLSPPGGASEGYVGAKIAINEFTSDLAVGGRYFLDMPGVNVEKWVTRAYSSAFRMNDDSNSAVGIGDLELKAFPVPANNEVQLIFNPQDELSKTIHLYDMEGRCIATFSSNESEVHLDLTNVKPGVYIVEAITASKAGRIRIIKN